MNDVFKIGTTSISYILKKGYSIKEDEDIVLKTVTMADGTNRRNLAEKKKIIININFSKIPINDLSNYLVLMENDFEATYYSLKYQTNKTGTFRLKEKPNVEMIGSYIDLLEEFSITLESV